MLWTLRSRPSGAAGAPSPTITWPTLSDATCEGAGAGQVSVPPWSDPSASMVDEVSTTVFDATWTVGVTGAVRVAAGPVPAALLAVIEKQKYSSAASELTVRLVAVLPARSVVGDEPEAGAQPVPQLVALLLATICW